MVGPYDVILDYDDPQRNVYVSKLLSKEEKDATYWFRQVWYQDLGIRQRW